VRLIVHVPIASCQSQVDAPTTPVGQSAPLEASANEALEQALDAPQTSRREEEPVSEYAFVYNSHKWQRGFCVGVTQLRGC
jgi:hypothetical protein